MKFKILKNFLKLKQ